MNEYEEMVDIGLLDFLGKWFKNIKAHIFKVEVTNSDKGLADISKSLQEVVSTLTALDSTTKKVEVLNQKELDLSGVVGKLDNVIRGIAAIPSVDNSKIENLLDKLNAISSQIRKVEVTNHPKFPEYPTKMEVNGKVTVDFPKKQEVSGEVSINNLKSLIDGLQIVVESINDLKLELPKAVSMSMVSGTTGSSKFVKETPPTDSTKFNASISLGYDGSGNLTTITKTFDTKQYRKTLTYNGSNVLTAISAWSQL